MDFTNENVELPVVSINELQLNSISARYRIINITINLLLTLIGIAVVWVIDINLFFDASEVMQDIGKPLYAGVLGFGLLSMTYHFFADPLIQYAVREQDVHFQSGLFFRNLVSQPILRIQHIELKRGPIERKAKLATLQVFSAGGVSHTFEIPGLEYEKAISLRKFIINHKDLTVDE
ncbi:PH domain-containing protein [Glaciecola siphonariae]|uniref:PH domain-containing protein n=1 Tax=Glaciecola siphonariae TaxID=521012 RepID=A0ABV9LYF2_9ALTE